MTCEARFNAVISDSGNSQNGKGFTESPVVCNGADCLSKKFFLLGILAKKRVAASTLSVDTKDVVSTGGLTGKCSQDTTS